MPQPHGAINQWWGWPLGALRVKLEDLAASITMHRLAHLIIKVIFEMFSVQGG